MRKSVRGGDWGLCAQLELWWKPGPVALALSLRGCPGRRCHTRDCPEPQAPAPCTGDARPPRWRLRRDRLRAPGSAPRCRHMPCRIPSRVDLADLRPLLGIRVHSVVLVSHKWGALTACGRTCFHTPVLGTLFSGPEPSVGGTLHCPPGAWQECSLGSQLGIPRAWRVPVTPPPRPTLCFGPGRPAAVPSSACRSTSSTARP